MYNRLTSAADSNVSGIKGPRTTQLIEQLQNNEIDSLSLLAYRDKFEDGQFNELLFALKQNASVKFLDINLSAIPEPADQIALFSMIARYKSTISITIRGKAKEDSMPAFIDMITHCENLHLQSASRYYCWNIFDPRVLEALRVKNNLRSLTLNGHLPSNATHAVIINIIQNNPNLTMLDISNLQGADISNIHAFERGHTKAIDVQAAILTSLIHGQLPLVTLHLPHALAANSAHIYELIAAIPSLTTLTFGEPPLNLRNLPLPPIEGADDLQNEINQIFDERKEDFMRYLTSFMVYHHYTNDIQQNLPLELYNIILLLSMQMEVTNDPEEAVDLADLAMDAAQYGSVAAVSFFNNNNNNNRNNDSDDNEMDNNNPLGQSH